MFSPFYLSLNTSNEKQLNTISWLLQTDIVVMPALNNTVAAFAYQNGGVESFEEVLQVICAWPVSGQYGPGARVL